jgi:uridine kinase
LARTEVVAEVADLIVAVPIGHPLRVAIDGITASGKTTFALEVVQLVRERGRPCVHVSMDGFHQPRAMRYRQGRDSAEGYYDDAYDYPALRAALLDPLGAGGDRRYRTSIHDLARDAPAQSPVEVAPEALVVVVDGTFLQRRELNNAWDVVVYLRVSFAAARARGTERDAELLGSPADAARKYDLRYHAACRRYVEEVDPEGAADIVVDNDDPLHPRVVEVAPELTRRPPHLRRTRAFFGRRAAGWEDRFPDDAPRYAAAVAELQPPVNGVVVDLGCGTGRALTDLRAAVGAGGVVIGIDATTRMLEVAREKHRDAHASVLLADAACLPIALASVDAFFAAGLLTHVPDPHELLRALARHARPGCRLALFHPVGRVALAARHGRTLAPDELLDPSVLPHVLAATGWTLERIDDADDRYLALARVADRIGR